MLMDAFTEADIRHHLEREYVPVEE